MISVTNLLHDSLKHPKTVRGDQRNKHTRVCVCESLCERECVCVCVCECECEEECVSLSTSVLSRCVI